MGKTLAEVIGEAHKSREEFGNLAKAKCRDAVECLNESLGKHPDVSVRAELKEWDWKRFLANCRLTISVGGGPHVEILFELTVWRKPILFELTVWRKPIGSDFHYGLNVRLKDSPSWNDCIGDCLGGDGLLRFLFSEAVERYEREAPVYGQGS